MRAEGAASTPALHSGGGLVDLGRVGGGGVVEVPARLRNRLLLHRARCRR